MRGKKINETRSWFFEKINKIGTSVPLLMRRQRQTDQGAPLKSVVDLGRAGECGKGAQHHLSLMVCESKPHSSVHNPHPRVALRKRPMMTNVSKDV